MGSPELVGDILSQFSKIILSDQIAWEGLSPYLIKKIFSFLNHKDRSIASTVCKAWANACDSPELWRCPMFKFAKKRKNKRFNPRQTVIRYGRFFRKLMIMYNRPKCNSMKFISKQISDFLEAMANTGVQVKSIRMARLRIITESCPHQVPCKKMVNFLRTQTGLTTVDFTNGRTVPISGVEILESLVPENVHHLMLQNFFRTSSSIITTSERYLTAMGRFSALRTLSLNYTYLSDQVMTCLTKTLSGHFEEFSILCKCCGSLTRIISDESWSSLRKKCPKMRVLFRLENEDLCTTFIINSNILSVEMPLQTMQYRLRTTCIEEYDHPIFDYLAENFSDTLRELEFDINGYEEIDVRTGIADIVGKCSMLENLTLKIRSLTFDVQDLLERVLEVLFTQITESGTMSLKIFRTTVRGLSFKKRRKAKYLERMYVPRFRDIGILWNLKMKK